MKQIIEIKIQAEDMSEITEAETEKLRQELQQMLRWKFGKDVRVMFVTREKK
jgi:predicted transcriptional regulator